MAARFLLDSNVIIAAIKGEPPALLNRLAGLAPERLCLSSIVLGELLTGALKSRRPDANKAAVLVATGGMTHLPFSDDDAEAYAGIRAALENAGVPVGLHDCQIAAQALTHGLVMVTANLKEFRRVPGLKCENWLK